jgi:GNAT superfamily N-acetyltransferase
VTSPADSAPSDGYRPLAVTPDERAQIEAQLSASFGLTADGARAWVDTTLRNGCYFGRKDGDCVAASFALEEMGFRRGDEVRKTLFLQSHYVHPRYRGLGYGVTRRDLDRVRTRLSADAVVLSLYADELVDYWEQRGFAVEQRREVVALSAYLERLAASFAPVLTAAYIAEKVHEAESDGAEVALQDGMLAIRARDDNVVTELLTVDPTAAVAAVDRYPALRIRLRTVMSYPRALGLFCPVDV